MIQQTIQTLSGSLNTFFSSQGYVFDIFPSTLYYISTTNHPLQTLDALPAHVLTPFIGPVPPSNLLDKIASGVAQAKGPNQWPYSLRATRRKLVELCRARAKEVSAEQKRHTIIEEEDMDQDLEHPREVLQHTTNIKRPLYRQSSMDFMQSAKLELCGTDPFTKYVALFFQSPSPSFKKKQ